MMFMPSLSSVVLHVLDCGWLPLRCVFKGCAVHGRTMDLRNSWHMAVQGTVDHGHLADC